MAARGVSNPAAKKRATLACQVCRERKVRCNVIQESPCSNCRWRGTECTVLPNRRWRRGMRLLNRAIISKPDPDAGHTSDDLDLTEGSTPSSTSTRLPDENSFLQAGRDGKDDQLQGRNDWNIVSPCPTTEITDDSLCHSDWLPSNSSWMVSLDDGLPSPWPDTMPEILQLECDLPLPQPLHPFITPLPHQLDAIDIEHLRHKGALALPSLSVQNALIQAYADFVHARFPILNLPDLLRIVSWPDGSAGNISLLLYWSILYSAATYVELNVLREAGYTTRREAKRDLYRKAEVLYNFDIERDRLVVIQGLLLIADWNATSGEQKDNWHWLGVVLTLAQAIGLHRDPANMNHLSESTKGLRRRMWWCCLMYDRLISLGLRYPRRIKDGDSDVAMLAPSDFERAYEVPDDFHESINKIDLVRDSSLAEKLTAICIARASLCLHIGKIIETQYSVLSPISTEARDTSSRVVMVTPKEQTGSIEVVSALYIEISTWYQNLPGSCHHQYPRYPSVVEERSSAVVLQRILLQMEYHTALSVLYKPWFSPTAGSMTGHSPTIISLSHLRVRVSASQVARLLSDLSHRKLGRYLPTTGVSSILSATIVHLASMKGPSMKISSEAVRDYHRCMGALARLRDVHADALRTSKFLEVMFGRLNGAPRFDMGGPSVNSSGECLEWRDG